MSVNYQWFVYYLLSGLFCWISNKRRRHRNNLNDLNESLWFKEEDDVGVSSQSFRVRQVLLKAMRFILGGENRHKPRSVIAALQANAVNQCSSSDLFSGFLSYIFESIVWQNLSAAASIMDTLVCLFWVRGLWRTRNWWKNFHNLINKLKTLQREKMSETRMTQKNPKASDSAGSNVLRELEADKRSDPHPEEPRRWRSGISRDPGWTEPWVSDQSDLQPSLATIQTLIKSDQTELNKSLNLVTMETHSMKSSRTG